MILRCRLFSISYSHASATFRPLRDIISGAIMAATSVPQLIAYAETVGYAGYRGLSTAGPPLLAWGVATGKFLFALHLVLFALACVYADIM
jgi:hypothetical protein